MVTHNGNGSKILFHFCSAILLASGTKLPSDIAKNISAILNQLVEADKYDKRLRPNYGGIQERPFIGEPVDVGITIYVSSISTVSEVAMDYTLDIYLRQSWTDRRLAFNSLVKELTIDVNYLSDIWVPDTFFPNEKQSYFHKATTHNSFLRIDRNGNVRTSQRITVTATCTMDLKLFPLDSQECTLELESYGYSTREIRYYWQFGEKNSVTLSDTLTLPQFSITGRYFSETEEVLATGNYSRMRCTFIFTRSLGFYLIQIYLPSNLIVIISWVSFWLRRDASPARVALGVTTVLTMTTLMSNTNAAMPKVSYVKSIDIYLGTCFLMVFASLLEYAAVGYLDKQLKVVRKPKRPKRNKHCLTLANQKTRREDSTMSIANQEREEAEPPPAYHELELCSPSSATRIWATNCRKRAHRRTCPAKEKFLPPFAANIPRSVRRETMATDQEEGTITELKVFSTCSASLCSKHKGQSQKFNGQSPNVPGTPAELLTNDPSPSSTSAASEVTKLVQMKVYETDAPAWRPCILPSDIDKYSRLLFPLLFAMFNCLYWSIYLYISAES